jgi:hypothetical protein
LQNGDGITRLIFECLPSCVNRVAMLASESFTDADSCTHAVQQKFFNHRVGKLAAVLTC